MLMVDEDAMNKVLQTLIYIAGNEDTVFVNVKIPNPGVGHVILRMNVTSLNDLRVQNPNIYFNILNVEWEQEDE